MSNAMKKLKLLHHLTAAASHPPPHAAAQALPTPPASPVSPQTSQIRHQYHPKTATTHAHYTDVLRSARAALHTLHNSQPSYTNTQNPPPAPMQRQPQPPQCMLPGGFMVLTPTSSYDNTPGLCVPASPPPQNMSINQPMQMQNQVPRGNTTIYSSRPPPPPTPTGSYSSSSQHQQRPRSPARPKLSRENVAKVGKDSRFARWERVLGYVREQRAATLPEAASAATNITPALAYHFSRSQERKRRADEFAAMDARNQVLDRIDLAEQDSRSLWSGGSGGTNGVDEFVWSEDEDDDVMPMPQAPTPMKVLPEEFLGASDNEGIFECEMQIDYSDFSPRRSMHSASHEHLGEKRGRPQSTPEEMAFQRLWGKRIVEEMPSLCREGELEGGLGRLVGRRMSAAY